MRTRMNPALLRIGMLAVLVSNPLFVVPSVSVTPVVLHESGSSVVEVSTM